MKKEDFVMNNNTWEEILDAHTLIEAFANFADDKDLIKMQMADENLKINATIRTGIEILVEHFSKMIEQIKKNKKEHDNERTN